MRFSLSPTHLERRSLVPLLHDLEAEAASEMAREQGFSGAGRAVDAKGPVARRCRRRQTLDQTCEVFIAVHQLGVKVLTIGIEHRWTDTENSQQSAHTLVDLGLAAAGECRHPHGIGRDRRRRLTRRKPPHHSVIQPKPGIGCDAPPDAGARTLTGHLDLDRQRHPAQHGWIDVFDIVTGPQDRYRVLFNDPVHMDLGAVALAELVVADASRLVQQVLGLLEQNHRVFSAFEQVLGKSQRGEALHADRLAALFARLTD